MQRFNFEKFPKGFATPSTKHRALGVWSEKIQGKIKKGHLIPRTVAMSEIARHPKQVVTFIVLLVL